MKACSVPIPPGRDRDERGQALRHLHEQHVPERLLDPERAEEEPDRDEAQEPVAGLPRRDRAEIAPTVREHGESRPDALLEVVDPHAQPEEADDPDDCQDQ